MTSQQALAGCLHGLVVFVLVYFWLPCRNLKFCIINMASSRDRCNLYRPEGLQGAYLGPIPGTEWPYS